MTKILINIVLMKLTVCGPAGDDVTMAVLLVE